MPLHAASAGRLSPALLADLLDRVRARSPLVHNITNYVAMDISANGLLAVGASPAMVHAEAEVTEFTALADALVINIGTLSPAWVAAMKTAAGAARAHGKPWVLDPVGAGATAYRTTTARELAALGPRVIRGNGSEILAVAGELAVARGVDSLHASDQALDAAAALARSSGAVVAVTGAIDYVTDGSETVAVANGHPMMTRVTAVGCTASALVGAFVAVEADAVAATAAALAVIGIAGELAAESATGPGSFRVALIDWLQRLDGATLSSRARLG